MRPLSASIRTLILIRISTTPHPTYWLVRPMGAPLWHGVAADASDEPAHRRARPLAGGSEITKDQEDQIAENRRRQDPDGDHRGDHRLALRPFAGRERSRPMLGHDLRRDQLDDEGDAQRHDEDVVELADDRNEIGD